MSAINQKEPYGRVCAMIGGVIAMMGLAMLAVQAFRGEWMMTVMVNEKSRQLGGRPLGFELASIVLAFGVAFLFIGLGYAEWSPRRGVPLTGIGVSNLVAAAVSLGAGFLGAKSETDFGWLVAAAWPPLILAGAALATLHPDFKHGRLIAEISAKYPVTAPDGFLYAPLGKKPADAAARGRQPRSLMDGYEAFARRMDGKLTVKKRPWLTRAALVCSVACVRENVRCAIDVETVPHGRGRRTITWVWFKLPQKTTFTCRITPQGMLTVLTNLFGSGDLRLGRDVFDDQFVLVTNDASRAPLILDETVQNLLLELKCFARQHLPVNLTGSGHVEFLIDETHLQMCIQGFLKDESQLLVLFELGGRIYDRLTSSISIWNPHRVLGHAASS